MSEYFMSKNKVDSKVVYDYYSPDDIYNKIFNGPKILGKDLSNLTPDDLQPVDKFHIRGHAATKE